MTIFQLNFFVVFFFGPLGSLGSRFERILTTLLSLAIPTGFLDHTFRPEPNLYWKMGKISFHFWDEISHNLPKSVMTTKQVILGPLWVIFF